MLSLIAGKYKGKKLYQFSNTYVRPTQAKIRKSVFQILEPFDGLEVLDLYAGVGTLGFEALSRGAALAVFVERDRRAYKILESYKREVKNFIQVCPKEMLDKLSNPLSLKEKITKVEKMSILPE